MSMIREVYANFEDKKAAGGNASDGHQHELFKDAYGQSPDVPSPAPESWTQTLVAFEGAAHSYGESKSQKHPFTAAEIAQAGTIAAVELNSEAQVTPSGMSILANDSPNRTPSAALEAALLQSHLQLSGLYSGSSGEGYLDDGQQLRETILSNASQSGSGGVEQSSLNDCSFESAVASLAATPEGQKSIAQMITQNKDGSYSVQFPGAKNSICVTEQDLEKGQFANSAQWANILEAASFKLDPSVASNGASGEHVLDYMSLLTGRVGDAAELSGHKSSEVEAALRKLLAHGAIVEGGGAPPGAPLESGHAYSVLSLKGDTVTVRNPWGNNEPIAGPEPLPGETKNGVTNLGGGELSMSVETYASDLPELFYSEQR